VSGGDLVDLGSFLLLEQRVIIKIGSGCRAAVGGML
jgi:hypothetical protein